jgi:hypothetical protein
MALKRIERKPLKVSGGLKEMEVGGIAKRRLLNSALDFVQNEEDVLADLPEDLSPEEAHVARMERLDDALNQKTTIKADLKRQGEAHKEQGRTDYHFVVCFADNEAATEFLRKLGYPQADAIFVDGHVLAGLLNIELPKPKFRLQAIRPPQRNLARLVTAFPKKK